MNSASKNNKQQVMHVCTLHVVVKQASNFIAYMAYSTCLYETLHNNTRHTAGQGVSNSKHHGKYIPPY